MLVSALKDVVLIVVSDLWGREEKDWKNGLEGGESRKSKLDWEGSWKRWAEDKDMIVPVAPRPHQYVFFILYVLMCIEYHTVVFNFGFNLYFPDD